MLHCSYFFIWFPPLIKIFFPVRSKQRPVRPHRLLRAHANRWTTYPEEPVHFWIADWDRNHGGQLFRRERFRGTRGMRVRGPSRGFVRTIGEPRVLLIARESEYSPSFSCRF